MGADGVGRCVMLLTGKTIRRACAPFQFQSDGTQTANSENLHTQRPFQSWGS